MTAKGEWYIMKNSKLISKEDKMYKVLSSFPVPDACLEPFRSEMEFTIPDTRLPYDTLVEMLKEGYDAFSNLAVRIDRNLIDAAVAGGVRVIANNMVGVDNVDLPYATEKGIAVINTPTNVTEPTAEHACALIVATMRNIACYDREIRKGVWNAPVFTNRATMIEGSTLGIVGLGRIGKRVAAKMQGMGMKVVYYDKFRLSEEQEKELGVTYMEFDELLSASDCISLNMPYLPENHHLFNEDTFRKMKREAYLVNTARGAIVDEQALCDALKNGVIKGAGLDVFEHEPHPLPELLELENVTMTPHCASGTMRSRVEIVQEALQGTLDCLNGKVPYNLVNKDLLK